MRPWQSHCTSVLLRSGNLTSDRPHVNPSHFPQKATAQDLEHIHGGTLLGRFNVGEQEFARAVWMLSSGQVFCFELSGQGLY